MSKTFDGAPGSLLRTLQIEEQVEESPRDFTSAEFEQLKSDGKLIPDKVYKITDVGDRGWYVRALTESIVDANGTAIYLTPAFYGVGAHNNNNWIGKWNAEKSVQVGDLAIWPFNKWGKIWKDKVWRNLTGAIGTSTQCSLDNVNWELVPRETGDIYIEQTFFLQGTVKRNGIELDDPGAIDASEEPCDA